MVEQQPVASGKAPASHPGRKRQVNPGSTAVVELGRRLLEAYPADPDRLARVRTTLLDALHQNQEHQEPAPVNGNNDGR
jgi:hypothetical protein